jgi:hypothetical protein
MIVFNVTGRHLTGADLRHIGRQFRRHRRRHTRHLIRVYGPEKGAYRQGDLYLHQELEPVQKDGLNWSANGVWRRGDDASRFVCDGGAWTGPEHSISAYPKVKV